LHNDHLVAHIQKNPNRLGLRAQLLADGTEVAPHLFVVPLFLNVRAQVIPGAQLVGLELGDPIRLVCPVQQVDDLRRR
jgi:hypothetical protein